MNMILSLLFVALLPIVASAYDAKIDGIYYLFSGDKATVTFQKHQNYTYMSDYTGEVVIPESVAYNGKTYSVTSIGNYAFADCSSLTSITIPSSVTSIGFEAFLGCSGLTSITIPNSVTSIRHFAFWGCSGLTSVTIGNGVTSIGDGAFYNCSSLTSVHITDVLSWCNIAFSTYDSNPLANANHLYMNGEEINDLVIPSTVISIGDYAFYGCSGLTSVTIPNSVTSIGSYAFSKCGSLTSVTIPNSVTSIGNYAFSYCRSLTSVTIPNSVTSIGESAFADCYVKNDSFINNSALTSSNNWGATLFDKQTNEGLLIADKIVVGCRLWATSITIPNSVTSIGSYAFSGCKGLTSITIPNSITSIGDGAFWGCTSMTSVHITDIAAWCKIAFESSEDCYSNPLYVAHHLYMNGEEIKDLVIPSTVTSIGGYAFYGCKGLTSVTIPNSVTSIGGAAFEDCTSLTSITIPNSVTSIKWETFSGCCNLTSITIPSSVTSIGEGAFFNCSGLTSVTIPNSVTSIKRETFSGCCNLTSITIPNSVTSIGSGAFYYSSGLTDVYCYAEIVPNTDSDAFSNSNIESATLHVPAGSLEAYRTTDPWSSFGTLVPLIYTLTYIVDGEVYKTYEVAYNEPITSEPVPTKEGYTFSGWSYIPGTMPATDVVIMGTFSINSYALTYVVDGEEYKTSTVVYGSEITPEAEPTKEGYTFSGWSEIPENMPAGDVVVTGSFIPNSYTLSYIVDGEEYKTASVTYGTAITPEADPTKEGYTFSGWSEIPNTMPAEDVTVTGSFTINQYLLTYILEGEEYKSYEIDFNTALTPEPAPTKKGMTFSGWGDVPEMMPAHDVTLTGSYTWSKEIVDGVVYQVADTLSNYASVVGYEGTGEEVTILSDVLIGEDVYAVNNIAENALPKTTTIYVSVGRLLLWLWTNGYEDIRDTDSGRCLPAPEISLEGKTASSLSLSYKNDYPEFSESITLQGSPVEKGKNGYDLALTGLEPDKLYEGLATLTLTYEEASYSKSFSFKTEPLTLTTQQPKIISLGNVIVAATSNLDDAEMNVGFEWRRTDWTDDFASNFGKAYLYKGTMEGYIRNLYIEKLWKYRPYYESNDGNRYYGNWVGIDPTNTSYFMPTVHTYSRINLTGNLAEVWGYVMRGTDNITMQGFIYWSISSTSSSRRNANGIPSDATKVLATGNVMSATLEDLDYDTEYCYMAFVTTSEGETFYGEPQSFRTTFDPDGIENVMESEEVTEVARYDIQGRKIDKPQKGINIIRFSDGTTKKVIVKQ